METVEDFFFLKNPLEALPLMLGKFLMVNGTGGRIVEAEAYLGKDDPGSFAFKGRKGKKKEALYRNQGSCFIYKIHTHSLLNIIFCKEGKPGAILIRALEPISGIEEMRVRRGRKKKIELCSGPGKLTQALGITQKMDGQIINKGEIKLFKGALKEKEEISFSKRIGIKKGINLPYRAFIKNSKFLSRRGDLNP